MVVKMFKRLYHHHYCIKSNDLAVHHAIQLKQHVSHFNAIPRDFLDPTLQLMPKHFFGIHTLEQAHYVNLPPDIYIKYFGHIKLYRVKDDKFDENLVTWAPQKLKYNNIFDVYLTNDRNIIILPNLYSLYVSSYIITYHHLTNHF